MSDENTWDKIRKELSSPWDWVAAGVGGAAGLGVSIATVGADAGTSAGTGALTAVSVRKAGAAYYRAKGLSKRANGLLQLLESDQKTHKSDKRCRIIRDVKRDLRLWEKKVINDEQFDNLLNQHIEDYRNLSKFEDIRITDEK